MNNIKAFIGSVPSTDTEPALRILHRLPVGMEKSPTLRLWNDTLHGYDMAVGFTLVVWDPGLLRQPAVAHSPLLSAGACFRGVFSIEGDLHGVLRLKNHLESIQLSWRDKLALLKDMLMLSAPDLGETKPDAGFTSRVARRFAHRYLCHSDRAATLSRYDVSNKSYELRLDEERVYSCAYFEQLSDPLDTTQRNELEYVCHKLCLWPGERLLDIGCDWGALVCWATCEHGVHAHGITLGKRQLEYARKRIRIEGLQDRVTVELRGYRDLEGEGAYDKVSSIRMFEHVDLRNLPAYYAAVRRMLKPGGLFLNHGITHDEEGWSKTAATELINRYVFPDGELDCISNIQLDMERAGLETHDVEELCPHHAMTLRRWVHRLEAQRGATIAEVGEAAYRVRHLYMAACALEFKAGGSDIYQVLTSNRHPGKWPVPTTRRDLYRSRPHWDWGN